MHGKDAIHHKLDAVDDLFPPERLARSRARWSALWRGERPPDRYPFVYMPTFNYYDDVDTPERRLDKTLDECLLHGRLHDDFIPSVFPGCRQATIPNLFGAREIVMENDYAAEKLIRDPADIDRLPEPATGPGTLARDWLDMQAWFVEATDGRLPVHVVDMQGPADVCGNLWSYDAFLMAAYEDPERFHRLMGRVTDAFVMFWKLQADLLGDLFVGTHLFGWDWVPSGVGATVSADSLVMISPDFYREFYQPYIERIARDLGGVTVHSCGNFGAVLPALCATPGLRGVNAGQMTLDDLAKAGIAPRKVISCGCDLNHLEAIGATIREHGLLVDASIHGIWPQGPATAWSAADWDEARRRDERVERWASELGICGDGQGLPTR